MNEYNYFLKCLIKVLFAGVSVYKLLRLTHYNFAQINICMFMIKCALDIYVSNM